MVIRSYTAESVAAALKRVRQEMGGAAVVLKTRMLECAGAEKQYEVTACLDSATVEQANAVLTSAPPTATLEATVAQKTTRKESPVAPAVASSAPAGLETRLAIIEGHLEQLLHARQLDRVSMPYEHCPAVSVAAAMQAADVPDHCVADFFEGVRKDQSSMPVDFETIRQRLIDRLTFVIDAKVEFKKGERILVAGPAGAGKTSVVGRLAARLTCQNHLPVKLVSLDTHKVGAIEELASYADLLGVDDYSMHATSDSKLAVDRNKVVLIDTCALPRDQERLVELKTHIELFEPTYRLMVFSALMRSSDVESYAREMAWLKPTHLVFTMIDLTRRLGSLLAAASASGLKIAMITDSSGGDGTMIAAGPTELADVILGREESRG
jgi:flagellar biosynthesis protein FlhF